MGDLYTVAAIFTLFVPIFTRRILFWGHTKSQNGMENSSKRYASKSWRPKSESNRWSSVWLKYGRLCTYTSNQIQIRSFGKQNTVQQWFGKPNHDDCCTRNRAREARGFRIFIPFVTVLCRPPAYRFFLLPGIGKVYWPKLGCCCGLNESEVTCSLQNSFFQFLRFFSTVSKDISSNCQTAQPNNAPCLQKQLT